MAVTTKHSVGICRLRRSCFRLIAPYRPGAGVLLHERAHDGKGFHFGQYDMRDRYDDQHASEFGDCWNHDCGMASEHRWHLPVLAGMRPVIAGRGNGHMGKDHILDLDHQDCTILHLMMITW